MEVSAKGSALNTRRMVRISILGLLGYIILMLHFPLPIFPEFLKLDIGNLPGIIASMTMGPMAGLLVELIKNLLKALLASKTVGIGEISNFICGIALVVPLGIVFKKMPNLKGYIIGSAAGLVTLCLAACISNYFFILPGYAYAMLDKGGMDAIIGMVAKINPNVTDLRGLILLSILPFNFIKGMLNVVLGYIIYKFARPLFTV